tara:strand:- start:214 stop:330 length:117 start_codon:yes stop_codon:yes gene_type:complete
VEEIIDQLSKNSKVTLDQIQQTLDEGKEKSFILKSSDK